MSAGVAEPLLPGLSGQGFGLRKGSVPRPYRGPSFAPPAGPPSPFSLSYGVSPAPPSGLLFGGLRFRSPKPWGPSVLVLDPGPLRALSFSSSWSSHISFGFFSPGGACTLNSLQFRIPPFPLPHLSVYLLSTLPEPRLNTVYRRCICWRPPHSYIVLFPLFLILVVGSLRSRGVRGRGT